jgi:Ca2+-binding RTX toxin-like protein
MKLKITLLALTAVASLTLTPAPGSPLASRSAAADCFSHPATIVGTPGDDRISGTSGADVIAALDGNDIVRGFGGNDMVCLGDGRDSVTGGAGNDQFFAEAAADGNDVFVGDGGQDRVWYYSRSSRVTVTIDGVADDGTGAETDNVGLSVENVTGGGADDLLIGSHGDNALAGHLGDDELRGDLGDDSLDGDRGIDVLVGGYGDDVGYGGADNDRWLAAPVADGADVFEGGSHTDKLSYELRDSDHPVTVRIDDLANDGLPGEGDNVRLDVENVTGTDGKDTITARAYQSRANSLRGGPGADFLDARDFPFAMNDLLIGGTETDICVADDDDATLLCEYE